MVTIFIFNGRLSDLSFRQCKGTKKSCVLQIKSQKRHEKRHVLKKEGKLVQMADGSLNIAPYLLRLHED
jgi:predicted Ser/Thr protein kinase